MCAYNDADGTDRRRAARSRAVGVLAELFAERTELLEELLTCEETSRKQARSALGRVPGPEVLDDGLRMDACVRILRELPHCRRPPQPLGGRTELREDLLVGIPPPHTGAKRGERRLVDAH